MALINNDIYDLYNEASSIFIDELGKDIIIYFINNVASISNNNGIEGMKDVDIFGNPSQISDFASSSNKQENSNYKEIAKTTLVKARIYQLDANNFYRSTGIRIEDRGFKMICYKSDIPKFLQGQYIEVESSDNPLCKN